MRNTGFTLGFMLRLTGIAAACIALGGATAIYVAVRCATDVPRPVQFLLFADKYERPSDAALIGHGARYIDSRHPMGMERWQWVSQFASRTVTVNEFDVGRYHTEVRPFEQLASDSASRAAIARHEFLHDGIDASFISYRVVTYGWPWRCLAWERAFTKEDAESRRWQRKYMSFPPAQSITLTADPANTLDLYYSISTIWGHNIPTHPLWDGIIRCSLFYGALWFLALSSPFFFVRLRRRVRGWCVRCGYDRQGLPIGAICPECGANPRNNHRAHDEPTVQSRH